MRTRRIVAVGLGVVAITLGALLAERIGRPRARPTEPAPVSVGPTPEASTAGEMASLQGRVRRASSATPARVELHLLWPFDGDGGVVWPDDDVRKVVRAHVPQAAVDTGPDGAYRFAGLRPGRYLVHARAADGYADHVAASIQLAGQRAVADLWLRPHAETLRGQVLDTDGRPARAEVELLLMREASAQAENWGPRIVVTDADGRFEVRGLPRVNVRAMATGGQGRVAWSGPVLLPLAGEITLRLAAAGAAIEGRVVGTDGDAPISGARVRALSSVIGRSTMAVADADGRFRLHLPDPGARLVVAAPGFCEVTVRPPLAGSPTVRLSSAARLRGRVRLPDGTGVGGIGIHLDRKEGWSMPEARTDADGRFAFDDLSPGAYAVSAKGRGWISANYLTPVGQVHDEHPHVLEAGKTFELDLPLVRAAEVMGRLVDAAGAPVTGALLHAGMPLIHLTGSWPRPLPTSLYYWKPFSHAVTATDGRFRFDSLVPGITYEIGVQASATPLPDVARVLAETPEAGRVELRLPSERWVDVLVMDGTGDGPLAHATVSAAREIEASDGSDADYAWSAKRFLSEEATVRTDAQGRARVGPLGAGHVSISAEADGHVRDGKFVTVARDAAAVPEVTLFLARARDVSGRVLLPDGTPAAGARIEFLGDGQENSRVVGTDGTFRFADVRMARGRLRASLVLDDGAYEASVSRPEDRQDVRLRRVAGTDSAFVTVRVVRTDGRPVPRADYTLCGKGGCRSGVIEGGLLVLDRGEAGLTTGNRWTLVVERARTDDDRPLPLSSARIEGTFSEAKIEVRLAPEGSVAGRVVGPDGHGVPGARVRALSVDGARLEPAWRLARHEWTEEDVTRTDAAGAFRVGGLAEGAHHLHVLPPDPFAVPAPVVVRTGADDLVVALRPGLTAVLAVVGPRGETVERARVILRRVGFDRGHDSIANLFWGSTVEEETAADGTVRVRGLDAGQPLLLGIAPPGSRGDLADHVDLAWSPASGTVTLEAARLVTGVVRDDVGAPLPEATVSCRYAGGVENYARSAEDGTFTLGGLPAGPVEVWATHYTVLPGLGPVAIRHAPVVRVEAGASDLVLTLR